MCLTCGPGRRCFLQGGAETPEGPPDAPETTATPSPITWPWPPDPPSIIIILLLLLLSVTITPNPGGAVLESFRLTVRQAPDRSLALRSSRCIQELPGCAAPRGQVPAGGRAALSAWDGRDVSQGRTGLGLYGLQPALGRPPPPGCPTPATALGVSAPSSLSRSECGELPWPQGCLFGSRRASSFEMQAQVESDKKPGYLGAFRRKFRPGDTDWGPGAPLCTDLLAHVSRGGSAMGTSTGWSPLQLTQRLHERTVTLWRSDQTKGRDMGHLGGSLW